MRTCHDISLYCGSTISKYIGNSNSPMQHRKGTPAIQTYSHYNYGKEGCIGRA